MLIRIAYIFTGAIQVPLFQCGRIVFPIAIGIALVAIRHAGVQRHNGMRIEQNILVVGNIRLQDTNQVLLPSRIVEDFALAWQWHLEYKHDAIGHANIGMLEIVLINRLALAVAARIHPFCCVIIGARNVFAHSAQNGLYAGRNWRWKEIERGFIQTN